MKHWSWFTIWKRRRSPAASRRRKWNSLTVWSLPWGRSWTRNKTAWKKNVSFLRAHTYNSLKFYFFFILHFGNQCWTSIAEITLMKTIGSTYFFEWTLEYSNLEWGTIFIQNVFKYSVIQVGDNIIEALLCRNRNGMYRSEKFFPSMWWIV